MHNGGLGGWKHIKRRLGERLADKWYLEVKGGTDSEWAFALFLDTLERLGYNPSACPEGGFGPTVLRKAVEGTIAQINEMTDAIPQSILQNENVDTRSLLNFAITDGHSVICTRYISSDKDEAASLYYSSGTQWATRTASPDDRQYQMNRQDKGADIVLVASEPLTFERGEVFEHTLCGLPLTNAENWVNVPTNSILTIHEQTVMVHPIRDRYYERDPYHIRSSAFVQAKGLVSNEKQPSGSISPAPEPEQPNLDGYRKMLTPSSGRSPDIPRLSRSPVSTRDVLISSHQASHPPSAAPPRSTPAQGNIKVKRRSVQAAEGTQDMGLGSDDTHSDNDEADEPASADVRNPRKLSQYFPELALASSSS